jgi:DNA-binding beta-propeller fold protein YncE
LCSLTTGPYPPLPEIETQPVKRYNPYIAQRISFFLDDSMVFTPDRSKITVCWDRYLDEQDQEMVPLPAPGWGTASNERWRLLLRAVPSVNKVSVLDLRTCKIIHAVSVPSVPQQIVVRPNDRVAYVSGNASAKVAVIGLSDWRAK